MDDKEFDKLSLEHLMLLQKAMSEINATMFKKHPTLTPEGLYKINVINFIDGASFYGHLSKTSFDDLVAGLKTIYENHEMLRSIEGPVQALFLALQNTKPPSNQEEFDKLMEEVDEKPLPTGIMS